MPLYTKNMVILLISISLFFSSFYLLLPTLPLYVQHMGGHQKDVGVIIGVFTISSVVIRVFAGRFTDKFGRKMLLLLGAFIFFVSPPLYYVASAVQPLFFVRIFHGAGIAFFTVSSISMIADMSPPHRRGEAFGAFGLSAMVALSGSPAVGTWLLTHFSFAAVFLAEAFLAGASLLLCIFIKETLHPYNPKSEQKIKGVSLPSVIIFLCTLTYGSIVAFLPFSARNISDFGFFYTAYAVSSIVVRIPMGKISDRLGRQKVILPGLITISFALILLAYSDTVLLLVLSGVLYGLGFSTVYPTLTALLVDTIPEEARASGLSIFTASFDLGIGAGSFIFGFLPLFWMYPIGSVVVLSGAFLFYLAERSSFSSSS